MLTQSREHATQNRERVRTMTDRERIEREIRDYLAALVDSVTFSNHLFQQETGLFAKLGPTLEDRKAVVQSEIWKLAQARLRELERIDLKRFRSVAREQSAASVPELTRA
jgi:hypothetical protein